MSTNLRISLACLACGLIILFGTTGYVVLEGFTWFEAFYMTIITVTTVGFGEINHLSIQGRAFTVVLIIVGFCSLAFVGRSLAESFFEKIWSKKTETKKMLKRISRLSSHYIICGYGRVGRSAADHFKESAASFVIIEPDPEHCRQIKEKGFLFLEGDATKEEDLLRAGIKKAAGLLTLLNSDPDNLFIVLSARELNPTLRIVSRSADSSSEHKIIQAGADNVMSPFKTAGEQIADDVLLATGKNSPGGVNSLAAEHSQVENPPQWLTVEPGSDLTGKSLKEISKENRQTILGIRHNKTDTIYPDLDLIVSTGDAILAISLPDHSPNKDRSIRSAPPKILIIDDNPVIVRLYTRLFQRAGFHPISATNGEEGLELIVSEKPVVAIIDFRLPTMSGVELCKKIRESGLASEQIQLILFTSDSQQGIREEALNSGADEVIFKSADAAELIDSVVHLLRTNQKNEKG